MLVNSTVVSARFYCDACWKLASTVYFLPPGAPDPRFDPEPAGVPPGVGKIGGGSARVSIQGGPSQVTISVQVGREEAVLAALRARDVKALRAVDSEFGPFWCYRCEKIYCSDHWEVGTRFDEGFFDCTEGFCPENHRQTLMD